MIAELWEVALMPIPEPSASDRVAINRTVEAVIRIGVIAGLIGWCFVIARPFLLPIIWGAIIAVTVFHGYERLEVAVGGRRVLAAVLVTLSMLVLLVVPSVLLGDSLVSGASNLRHWRLSQLGDYRPISGCCCLSGRLQALPLLAKAGRPDC
jgi:predicted PurR-regulated permease PerM